MTLDVAISGGSEGPTAVGLVRPTVELKLLVKGSKHLLVLIVFFIFYIW